MNIAEATELIRFRPDTGVMETENWADLGCGAGTFTGALAGLLAPGSEIRAVDQDAGALKKLPSLRNGVTIIPVQADFASYVNQLRGLDGVIMANALHFIREQEEFLRVLKNALKPAGHLLLVEYDLPKGSRWVPYPLTPTRAAEMLKRCDYGSFTPLRRRPSRYGPQDLYSALVNV